MEPAKIKRNLWKATKFAPGLLPSPATSLYFDLLKPKRKYAMNFKLLAFRTSLVLNLIMDYWGRSESDLASSWASKTKDAAPVKEEKPQEEEANVNVGNIFSIVDDY